MSKINRDLLIEQAIEVLKLDMHEEGIRHDLTMIASLIGPEAIQKRIDDAKAAAISKD